MQRTLKVALLLSIGCLMVCTDGFAAQEAASLEDVFRNGTFYGDMRIRYEYVDQNGIPENAHARTGRARGGFKTGEYMHLSGVIEGESVLYLGDDDYNDTVNGKTDHPVVADPENIQVNQAYVQFTGIDETVIKGGRQVITLDGHRFIGDVGWRQNNQVYDAARVENTSLPDTVLQYGYIYNVNRIFGEQSTAGDWESGSHFFHAQYKGLPEGVLTAYAYLLDFNNDSPANSSKTFGGSFAGKHDLSDAVVAKLYGEYAFQQDYGKNSVDYSAHYIHVAPALSYRGATVTVGYEILGSDDGRYAFRTPLATLHKWNGWADKFLTTPNNGLRDFYLDVSYVVPEQEGALAVFNGLLMQVQLHDFDADEGSLDHGQEWGLYFKKPIQEHVVIDAKLASYEADNTSTDTVKFILGAQIKF